MKEKIDFRKVAYTVRFELMSSINMPTPSDYQMLSDEEQQRMYARIFDLHHDVCNYLSSYLDIDKLSNKYEEINSQDDSRNDAADE